MYRSVFADSINRGVDFTRAGQSKVNRPSVSLNRFIAKLVRLAHRDRGLERWAFRNAGHIGF